MSFISAIIISLNFYSNNILGTAFAFAFAHIFSTLDYTLLLNLSLNQCLNYHPLYSTLLWVTLRLPLYTDSSLIPPSFPPFHSTGMAGKVSDEDMFRLEQRMKKSELIIASMTEEERTVPDLLARQVRSSIVLT